MGEKAGKAYVRYFSPGFCIDRIVIYLTVEPGFAIFICLWYIKDMDYALEERIGNPDLFTGRKEELGYFLKWIDDIKERKSQSTALLARRKMGKTAIMKKTGQSRFPCKISDFF